MTSDVYQIKTAGDAKTFFANVTKLLNDKFIIKGAPTPAQFKQQEEYLAAANKKVMELNARAEKEPEFKKLIQPDLDKLVKLIEKDTELLGKNAPLVNAPASGQQTQAPSSSFDPEGNLKKGQAAAKSREAPAEEAGKELVNGAKKIWNGAGEMVSDAKDAISGDTKKDAASTPASAAEAADGKNTKSDKDKKSFLGGLEIGDILGGLLGGAGGFMLGNMFGGGMIGNIVGIMLAVGGVLIGKRQLGPTINGWMGRKSDTPANGPKKEGAERGQQAQKEAGAPAGTSKSMEQEKDKPAPTPSDAYSVYQAYLASKQPAESATAYTYINPAMDPSPEPTQPLLPASNAWRKQTPNFRH